MAVRIGIGYDVHRLGADRALRLGGIEIDFESGLQAHSDGDVVLHAIADALLGAAALGDIGVLFPPSDAAYANVDSGVLLRDVVERVQGEGWSVCNVDATVLAEAPRISPHTATMRARIAELLGVAVGVVSVKATTLERLGPIGRGEGIACLAVASLEETP